MMQRKCNEECQIRNYQMLFLGNIEIQIPEVCCLLRKALVIEMEKVNLLQLFFLIL